MREREQETIYVSQKHIKARVILFALAFCIAIGSFTVAVTSLRKRNVDTYEEINRLVDEAVPHYSDGIHYYCNFSKATGDRPAKELRRAAQDTFNQGLKRAYRLLDPVNTYPDFVNLATINQKANQIVTVPEELYQVLQDAAERTSVLMNYSIYAGPLFGEWNPILQSINPEEFDPLFNEYEKDRLEKLGEALILPELKWLLSSQSNPDIPAVELEFLGDNRVRLTVPEKVEQQYRDLEITAPILDLNNLRDAYLLQLTSAFMAKENITFGYFYAESGLLLHLDENRAYALFDAEGVEAGSYAYSIEVQGVTHYRHLYFVLKDSTFTELLKTVQIEGPKEQLVDEAAALAYLNSLKEPLQIAEFERTHGDWIIQYTYQ